MTIWRVLPLATALLTSCVRAPIRMVDEAESSPPEEAESAYYQRKLAEARGGEPDLDFINSLAQRNLMDAASGDVGATIASGEVLLEMVGIAFGQDDEFVILTANFLIDAYLESNRIADASQLLARTARIYAARPDTDSATYVETLIVLAGTYLELGKAADAEPVLLEALAVAERDLGADAHAVGVICAFLSKTYEALGDGGAALQFRARATRILGNPGGE